MSKGKKIINMNTASLVWARFIGWQEGLDEIPALPLFNIEGDHIRARSTVDAQTLRDENIPIPSFPDFETWKRNSQKK